MKVLTATKKTQGWRDNDFCWAVEGELVVFPPIECSCGSVDDGCGCHRAMAGLASHRATTTIEVRERKDLNHKTYFALVADGLEAQGYLRPNSLRDPEVRNWLVDVVGELEISARVFPAGAVLERRGNCLHLRPQLS